MPLLPADGRGNALVAENREEFLLRRLGGTFPRKTFDGVVGDEVDFGPQSLRSIGQQARLGGGVVHTLDQDVLEGDHLLLALAIVGARIHQLGNGVLLVHRHDLTADLVTRPMERNGQSDLERLIG